mgnify:CR=1 FL=1
MDPDWNSTFRPSKILIPREGKPSYENGEFVFNVRASRLGMNVRHEPLRGQLQIDFYGTGTQRSQLPPRLRQAHIVYGALTVGQAWSLFCDIEAFPMTLDFWGPNGLIASRRPQVRWTIDDGEHRTIAIAAENPGAGLDEGKAPSIDPDLGSTDRNLLPDFTAACRLGATGATCAWRGWPTTSTTAARTSRATTTGPTPRSCPSSAGPFRTRSGGRTAIRPRSATATCARRTPSSRRKMPSTAARTRRSTWSGIPTRGSAPARSSSGGSSTNRTGSRA